MASRHRNRITLTFDVKPRSKQSTRFASSGGKTITYTDKKVKQYQDNLLIEALSQRPGTFRKITGAIFAIVVYRFRPEKDLEKTVLPQIRSGKKVYKVTSPDLTDNLNKPLFDALQGHFYTNDSQVVRHSCEKIYSLKAGITLTLIEIS